MAALWCEPEHLRIQTNEKARRNLVLNHPFLPGSVAQQGCMPPETLNTENQCPVSNAGKELPARRCRSKFDNSDSTPAQRSYPVNFFNRAFFWHGAGL